MKSQCSIISSNVKSSFGKSSGLTVALLNEASNSFLRLILFNDKAETAYSLFCVFRTIFWVWSSSSDWSSDVEFTIFWSSTLLELSVETVDDSEMLFWFSVDITGLNSKKLGGIMNRLDFFFHPFESKMLIASNITQPSNVGFDLF